MELKKKYINIYTIYIFILGLEIIANIKMI